MQEAALVLYPGFSNTSAFVEKCIEESDGSLSVLTEVIGWIICVGAVCSYSPQGIKMIKRKSTMGVSVYFAALSAMAGLFAISTIVLQDGFKYSCCAVDHLWSSHICALNLLQSLQFASTMLGQQIIWILWLYYSQPGQQGEGEAPTRAVTLTRRVLAVAHLLLLLGLIIACPVLLQSLGSFHEITLGFADAFSALNVALGLILYVPQIVSTYKLKTAGSFSLITLGLQIFGSLFNIYFQISADAKAVEVYVPMICTTLLGSILMAFCVFYECKNRSKRKTLEAIMNADMDEEMDNVADGLEFEELHGSSGLETDAFDFGNGDGDDVDAGRRVAAPRTHARRRRRRSDEDPYTVQEPVQTFEMNVQDEANILYSSDDDELEFLSPAKF